MVSYSQRIFLGNQEIRVFLLRNEPKRTHQNCHEIWISWQPQTSDAKRSVMVAKFRLRPPKINSSPLKNDGWKSTFLLGFGMVLFQGLTVKRGGCKDVSCHRGDWHPHLGHPEESFRANPGDMYFTSGG